MSRVQRVGSEVFVEERRDGLAEALGDLERASVGTVLAGAAPARLPAVKPPLVEKQPTGAWAYYELPYERPMGTKLPSIVVVALLTEWADVCWFSPPPDVEDGAIRALVRALVNGTYEAGAALPVSAPSEA